MPLKRHETVDMTDADLRDAIRQYLNSKYGQPDGCSEWTITLKHTRTTTGEGWGEVDHEHFSAHVAREIR